MNRAGELAQISFFTLFIAAWTFAAAYISHEAVRGELVLWFFLVTHGGAELLLLQRYASTLQGFATGLPKLATLTHDHAGLRAAWPLGGGRLIYAAWAAVFGTALHGVLFGALAFAVATPGAWWSVAILTALAWCVSVRAFGAAIYDNVRYRGEVVLEADFDEVRVTTPAQVVRLPLHRLRVQATPDGFTLEGDGQRVSLRLDQDARGHELRQVLATMALKSEPPQAAAPPAALDALRQGVNVVEKS